MQVAGRGGVQQDGPGDVAMVLVPVLLLNGPAHNVGIEEEVFEGGLQHAGVGFVEGVHNQAVHVAVGIFQHSAHRIALGRKAVRAVACQLIHPAHQLDGVLLRILFQIAECGFQGDFLDLLG